MIARIVAVIDVLLVLLIADMALAQDIYKWKDERGQWHFSQTPPAQIKTERAYADRLSETKFLTIVDWYSKDRIYRDLDFLSLAVVVLREDVDTCPANFSLAAIQKNLETSYLKSLAAGNRNLLAVVREFMLDAGCRRISTATSRPVAATQRLPALEAGHVLYQVIEKNNTWWKLSWKVDVSNRTAEAKRFAAVIKFEDNGGYVLDDTVAASLVLGGYDRQTYNGYALISSPLAPRVSRAVAEIRIY